MSSTIELVNRALARIGEQRLASIDDTSERAQTVRDVLTGARQAMLREHRWNFAVRRARLTPELPAPEFRWLYRMGKPNASSRGGAWLRTLGVFADESERQEAEYQDEGRHLLTDHQTLFLKYVADVTNPLDMDALFREALTFKLAAELAVSLSSSRGLAEGLAQMAEDKMRKAVAVDAVNNAADQIEPDTWELARWGSHGRARLRGEVP